MKCYLCGSNSYKTRPGKVRDNLDLSVIECENCGLVSLSSFDHISDSFYQKSGMHQDGADSNVQAWLKETEWDDERRVEFLRQKMKNQKVLDVGCGNGGFLMKAANITASVVGVELETALQPHFHQMGLKVYPNMDGIQERFDLITMFHVLEHLPEPNKMLNRLSELLEPSGQLIIEVPNADDALLTLYKNEPFSNFTYWSCHLFLYNTQTLARLARQCGWQVDFLKQIQRYPLSNHLQWLAQGKPGGHVKWSFLDSSALNAAYSTQLAAIGKCDTIIIGLSQL